MSKSGTRCRSCWSFQTLTSWPCPQGQGCIGTADNHRRSPPPPPSSSLTLFGAHRTLRCNKQQKTTKILLRRLRRHLPSTIDNPRRRGGVRPDTPPPEIPKFKVMSNQRLCEGNELTQTAQEIFNSCVSAVTSRQHSVLGNAMHAVRTQCKVLDVGQYSNPSFGPF